MTNSLKNVTQLVARRNLQGKTNDFHNPKIIDIPMGTVLQKPKGQVANNRGDLFFWSDKMKTYVMPTTIETKNPYCEGFYSERDFFEVKTT